MTDDPTLLVVPRGRGRPRSPVESAPCTTHLPVDVLDNVIALARAERVSVSALLREVIVVTLVARNIRTE